MFPASAPLPSAACFSSRSMVFASRPPAMRALRRMPSADEVRRRLASRDEYDEGLLDPTELQEYLERIVPRLSRTRCGTDSATGPSDNNMTSLA